jgi:hypothetical protein
VNANGRKQTTAGLPRYEARLTVAPLCAASEKSGAIAPIGSPGIEVSRSERGAERAVRAC